MSSVAAIRAIEIARIDTSGRLRGVNPDAVAAYAEERAAGAVWPAIRVVERGDGFKLVHGLQRLEAAKLGGALLIEADVRPAAEYATDADVSIAEIYDNILRLELTRLDRAVHIAAWKAIYDAETPVAKHGGRRDNAGRKSSGKICNLNSAPSEKPAFSERFSVAAARFLDISERSVRLALEIAHGVGADIRARIALHEIAQSQTDLLALAKEEPARQAAICDLLLAAEPTVRTVFDAIAVLDKVDIVRREGWELISDRFSRLKPAERHAFYEAHEADFRGWLAEREAAQQRRPATRKVA